jgi:hypothetical protein
MPLWAFETSVKPLRGVSVSNSASRCTGAAQVNDKAAALRKQIEDLELALKVITI